MEHHVYFWLQEERRTEADRAAFEEGLAGLLRLPGVAGGMWGTPAPVMPRPVIDNSWDYALSMRFESVANHDAYQNDAAHHAFIDRFKDLWAKVLVMDVQEK
jgi:hypothetical protein